MYKICGDGKKEKNAHEECRVQKNTQKVILQQWHPVVIFVHSPAAAIISRGGGVVLLTRKEGNCIVKIRYVNGEKYLLKYKLINSSIRHVGLLDHM